MTTFRAWSSKHISYWDGDTIWIRADYLDRMRPGMIDAGHTETGRTLVTGGKTYHQFTLAPEGV